MNIITRMILIGGQEAVENIEKNLDSYKDKLSF